MLCRTTADCDWLNKDLKCSSYKLSFTPNRAWFNGDSAGLIHGQCECPVGMNWNNREMTCYVPEAMSGWVIVLIVVLVLLVVVSGGAKQAHNNNKQRTNSLETPLSNRFSNSSQ